MSWFSILPAKISFIETWAIRIFVFLGIIVIGPWALFLLYDAILYIFRRITYDIPYLGGRARNRPRPRAPSLSERPMMGRTRTFSLTVPVERPTVDEGEEVMDGLKKRLEKTAHERSDSNYER